MWKILMRITTKETKMLKRAYLCQMSNKKKNQQLFHILLHLHYNHPHLSQWCLLQYLIHLLHFLIRYNWVDKIILHFLLRDLFLLINLLLLLHLHRINKLLLIWWRLKMEIFLNFRVKQMKNRINNHKILNKLTIYKLPNNLLHPLHQFQNNLPLQLYNYLKLTKIDLNLRKYFFQWLLHYSLY